MRNIYTIIAFCMFFTLQSCKSLTEEVNIDYLDQYNVVWDTQSKNSSESMPVGGGDIGCNVWVENGDILFYMSRSGAFDENNTMLKLGRTRVRLSPSPFEGRNATFKQELNLREGCVYLTGKNDKVSATVKLWVEVFSPEIHVDIESSIPVEVESVYETWRAEDRPIRVNERWQCLSFIRTNTPLFTYKDSIHHTNNEIIWYHRNKNKDLLIDKCITQQNLSKVREKFWNPQKGLTFGGSMRGTNMTFSGTVEGKYIVTGFKGWKLKSNQPSTQHEIDILLHVDQTETIGEWKSQLSKMRQGKPSKVDAWKKNLKWWGQYWNRSHIVINPGKDDSDEGWKIGRNYQLFRYMLGCNAYGEYPTKFNGGLFTVDGHFTIENSSPDFRLWGGGSFTAQNQRLVYWPMLKSGDFDMMHSQFEYYLQMQKNAELRTKTYWGHKGASFAEQIENFGLPIASTYYHIAQGLEFVPRPDSLSVRKLKDGKGEIIEIIDKGYLANPWTGDEYETILEFCLMILDVERYTGQDISRYMPLVESSVTFFDEHYRYWGNKLNGSPLDKNGHLVLYPATACETYKMAKNPTPLVSGLKTVLSRMLELPEHYSSENQRKKWESMLNTIPPIHLMEKNGHTVIAPAKEWERINNIEFPQLYAVYPYNHYGIGKPDLDIAIDTWEYGFDNENQRQSFCWFQSGIFCARLGLVYESVDYLKKKMLANSMRFPVFWNIPGFDQWPDMDHGGAGAINLQEMVLQTDGKEIRVLPTWPKEWDVEFKLHAPYNTVTEVSVIKGKIESLKVTPESRLQDVIIKTN